MTRPTVIQCKTCTADVAVSPAGRVPRFCGDHCRKASYGGKCVDCGAPTSGADGRAKAPKRCRACSHLHEGTREPREAQSAKLAGRVHWTDDDIGRAMWAAARDGYLSGAMYDEARERDRSAMPSRMSIMLRFGSWNAACERFGLRHGTGRGHYAHISEADCIAAIRAAARDLGPLPTYERYEEWAAGTDWPSGVTVRNRLGGTWMEALRRAEELAA
jgi:hypothetical protein